MTELAELVAQWAAVAVEMIGVFIITAYAVHAAIFAAFSFFRKERAQESFYGIRQNLGRGILLGLEFLVAADIIHTVAVELSFETVGVLAIVVLIRTFLSFTLDLELTGRWPWQKSQT